MALILLHPLPSVLAPVNPPHPTKTACRHRQEHPGIHNHHGKVGSIQLRVLDPTHKRPCERAANHVPHPSNRRQHSVVRIVELIAKVAPLDRVDQRREHAEHAAIHDVVRNPNRPLVRLCRPQPQ